MSRNRLLLDSSAAVRSTGLVVVAKLGSTRARPARVSSFNIAIGMLLALAASAVSTQVAPELETATSRRPAGFQPLRYNSAASTRPPTSRARKKPCFSKKASTTRSSLASAPVCDCAAIWPAAVRPDLSAITGRLRSAAILATSMNGRASGMLSRYNSSSLTPGSLATAQASSPTVMSASLPVACVWRTPMPRRRNSPKGTTVMAPD